MKLSDAIRQYPALRVPEEIQEEWADVAAQLESQNAQLKKATEILSVELIREELGGYCKSWTGWDRLRVATWKYADMLAKE